MGDTSKGEANTFYPVKKCTKSLRVNIELNLYRNGHMFQIRKNVKNTNMVMVNSCCYFVKKRVLNKN